MSVLGGEMRKAQNNPVERLVRRSQYLRVARARKYIVSKGLILQFEIKDPNEGGNKHRVGFTASKKVGNAVVRNRARRRLKSVVNDVLTSSEEQPLDLVLIGRASTLKRSYDELLSDFRFALKSARTRQEKVIGRAKDE
jgi:ribonuclease P protein component|tara:strand:- start:242 stop:658 length:417 start_codon:yes stop_codon:yes gene_type:complete